MQNDSVLVAGVQELEIGAEFETSDPGIVVVDYFGWTCLVVQIEYSERIVHVSTSKQLH